MKTKEELKELRAMDVKNLTAILKKEYDNLRKLKSELKMRELKDINKVKKTKKKIARILTILREKLIKELQEKESLKE